MRTRAHLFAALVLTIVTPHGVTAQSLTQEDARHLMRKVARFHRQQVGYEGAYLWKYSADLTHQEGEGIATRTSGWTQPPGAPSVGEAYLKCWRLTDDTEMLDAAVEVAGALVRSQLKSGGWSSHFDLGREGRRRYAYRVDGQDAGRDNRTTFDDNKTQSALTLLMHADQALKFADEQIHECVEYALDGILAAQYPNGAWPQQYAEAPDPKAFPVIKAGYPEEWPREYPQKKYIDFYTLNDANMSHIVEMLFEAARIYEREDCRNAAIRTGEFFLLAQMPDPQPGWAQQYDVNMHPVWARKFEPPAVTGGESQAVMRSLLTLYRHSADRRFLDAIPRALRYYRSSLLPEGKLARFYELKTNRPLFFTREYELTYSDADMPTHYAFKVSSKLDSIEREYQRLKTLPAGELRPTPVITRPLKISKSLQRSAEKVAAALDDRNAWTERGSMKHTSSPLEIIDMRTFARNLETLAAYAGATPSQ